MVTTQHRELFHSIQHTPIPPAPLGCLGSDKVVQELNPQIPGQNTAKGAPKNWQMKTSPLHGNA